MEDNARDLDEKIIAWENKIESTKRVLNKLTRQLEELQKLKKEIENGR
jgi:hypothetical protein